MIIEPFPITGRTVRPVELVLSLSTAAYALAVVTVEPVLLLPAAALVFGWSQIGGA